MTNQYAVTVTIHIHFVRELYNGRKLHLEGARLIGGKILSKIRGEGGGGSSV